VASAAAASAATASTKAGDASNSALAAADSEKTAKDSAADSQKSTSQAVAAIVPAINWTRIAEESSNITASHLNSTREILDKVKGYFAKETK
jgi:hypothetical protein